MLTSYPCSCRNSRWEVWRSVLQAILGGRKVTRTRHQRHHKHYNQLYGATLRRSLGFGGFVPDTLAVACHSRTDVREITAAAFRLSASNSLFL